MSWGGRQKLEHTDKPKYLGLVHDHSLIYKYHCQNTRQKVTTRNNLLKKLAGSKWEANPKVLRTTAEAMSLSKAEYACPVWGRSKHSKQVTMALNNTCRIITGYIKATPLPLFYRAAGFVSQEERRTGVQYLKTFKQTFDDKYPLHQLEQPEGCSQLKSRKRFMRTVNTHPQRLIYPLHQEPSHRIETEWKTWRIC